MKMMLAAAAALLAASAASATTTTTDYSFTASYDTGPYATISGTFSITADDVAETNTLTALDFSIGGYAYNTSNVGLIVHGSIFGPASVLIGGANLAPDVLADYTNDFALTFNPLDLSAFGRLNYVTPDIRNIDTSAFSISAVGPGPYLPLYDPTAPTDPDNPGGVPEPASWALMLAGFGLVGGTLRRRRVSLA